MPPARPAAAPSRFRTLLLAAALVALPAAGEAQQRSDERAAVEASPLAQPPCTYDRCALRVEDGFFSRQLVRGVSGETVARLGLGGPNVVELLGVNDSARVHAVEYRQKQRLSNVLTIVGGVASLASYIALLGDPESDDTRAALIAVNLGGTVVTYAGTLVGRRARRELDRAVWWYNRAVVQP